MMSRLLLAGLALGFGGLAQATPIAKMPAMSSNLIQAVRACPKGTHPTADGRCRFDRRPPTEGKCPPGMYHGPYGKCVARH